MYIYIYPARALYSPSLSLLPLTIPLSLTPCSIPLCSPSLPPKKEDSLLLAYTIRNTLIRGGVGNTFATH